MEAVAVAFVRASTEKPRKGFFTGGGGGEEEEEAIPSPSSSSLSEGAGMEELRLGDGVSVLVLVSPLTSSARRRRFLAVPVVSFREYVVRGGALLVSLA